MRISDRVYLIGSGALGVNLSHPKDCNVYAVDCGDEFLLVDSGAGRQTSRLVDNLVRSGIDPARVRHLFLTHGHLDHSGGVAALQRELDLRIYCSAPCAGFLRTGDQTAISLTHAKKAGIYSPDFDFSPASADRVLSDGDTTGVGDARVAAIATPGHSGDMLSYRVTLGDSADLFSGDTIFHGGKILLSAVYDCDVQAYVATLRRLRNLDVRGLFPGHGLWSLDDGRDHLERANQALDRLLLPANLI